MDIISFLGSWGWMSVGLVLILLELIVPGTFIIWFGVGAVATGIVDYLMDLSVNGQLMTFLICSGISVAFGLLVYRKVFGMNKEVGTHTKTGAHKYIGQSFKVVEAIVDGTGKVAVGDTVWLAHCEKEVAKGKMVKVIDVEGTVLIVE